MMRFVPQLMTHISRVGLGVIKLHAENLPRDCSCQLLLDEGPDNEVVLGLGVT